MNSQEYLMIDDLDPDNVTRMVPVMIISVTEKKDKNNSSYCSIKIMDTSSKIYEARKFQETYNNISSLIKDGFYKCYIKCSLFNEQNNYVITSIGSKLENFQFNLPAISQSSKKLYNQIIEELKNCNSNLKDVALSLFKENKNKILEWTAGKTVHHTNRGDFLLHTYNTMEIAKEIGLRYSADVDLLIIGGALHDIGKLKELTVDEYGLTDYSIDGQLFGHSYIGAKMIEDKYKELNPKSSSNNELLNLLVHMILSHHGEKQFNAATVPVTKEAFILHFADMIDSRLWIINDTLDKLKTDSTAVAHNLTNANTNFIYKPKFAK